MKEVVVVSGVRTAIGTFGGSLKDVPPTKLAALVTKEALARAKVDGKDVENVVFGHVINTEPRDMYMARVAAIEGGCAQETPALTVNRLCGSGLQAIVSAAQSIQLGDAKVAVGGGAESMSRAPFASLTARWGARMGDSKMVDMMLGALHDPFQTIHMGVTAENVAKKWGISRETQDQTALDQPPARAEGDRGRLLQVRRSSRSRSKSSKGTTLFDTDEHVRRDAKIEDMAKLKPAFLKENGTVTAGNASGINDAAAAVVLMEKEDAARRGLKPMARVVAYAFAGVDPTLHGHRPGAGLAQGAREARASRRSDMDVVEANEAFAAQACAVTQDLRPGPGQGQPQRLGHLARPPGRRHRRADHRQGPVRAASASRAATRW